MSNHWFAIYYIYYKEKLEIIELTYNSYLFFRSKPLGIIGMQTNDILILANNNFANTKKEVIKSIKIIIKNKKHFTFIYSLKFNNI